MANQLTELVLMTRVARAYFIEDRSKTEIAQELGISRFRVARLLQAARSSGLVRIDIASPSGVDTDLSVQLQEAFGLRHVVVVDTADDDPTALRQRLGAVAAEVLQEIVTPNDVLGLAWARSLRGIGSAVTTFAACPVVQLTGALSGPDGSDVLELVRRVAGAGGGTPYVFYAPLVVADAATARAVRRQADVSRANELFPDVTVAAVGIGSWEPGLSTIYDMVEPAARARTSQLGAVGEISGAFIDASGKPLTTPLSKRIIGVTGEQLAGMHTVVAVAYGVAKVHAVHAAISGGLVNGLITHSSLARQLLLEIPKDVGISAVGAGAHPN